ncbi:TPA: hypothetical protein N0F65_006143 [Lagenidium giganteum]|uniref:Uncharacterized protein n=1 Tax=Lagenidium giganteum TaxID=4803 RepID=A0AAV2Z0R0_9STRA|nr:TPA: hypothetical protein N0F65_006143 [Lagenidium giganteum]
MMDGAHTAASQAATPSVVSPEIAQTAPLLVGTFALQDKHAVWSGRWGMTEAAFGAVGITSPFEMKSQDEVQATACNGSTDKLHPAFLGRVAAPTMKQTNAEDASASAINVAFLGYTVDASTVSTEQLVVPTTATFEGSFQIQATKGKTQTVTEKSVVVRFVHDLAFPQRFFVTGTGENRFGAFDLQGTLDKATMELRVYKIYKPKEKEKRVFPRRGRAPRLAVVNNASKSSSKSSSKASTPVAIVTPPGTTPVSDKEGISVASFAVTTPMSDQATSPSGPSRGRSERKRVVPAHLREDAATSTYDPNPALLKRCYTILKAMMVNPKAGPFLTPVDPVALGIPDYFQVIKRPMDLGTIRQNLECGVYDDPVAFAEDVRLVFSNAMLYNAAHSQVHIFAVKLAEDFEKKLKPLNLTTTPVAALKVSSLLAGKNSPFTSSAAATTGKPKKEKKSSSDATPSAFTHTSKKVRGGKGTKGNTKRRPAGAMTGDQELIMSLKEDIERLKAKLDQIQPNIASTPKLVKMPSRPFKMDDLTEEELSRPMTQMEKARLSADLKLLPQDKTNRVLQIIAEAMPVAKLLNEHDEVELDINAFDTRCLRMLEGYVRESGIGRKRKRAVPKAATAKKSRVSAPTNRLTSAKMAAQNIQSRKEELENQLAAIDGDDKTAAAGAAASASAEAARVFQVDVGMTDAEVADKHDEDDHSSGTSSSSSSSSESDSESDSDSDDGGAPHKVSDVVMW